MRRLAAVMVCVALCSCQRTPGGVVDKVLVDFGIREKPEGYVTGGDKVFARLTGVGKAEMRRINQEGRHGEVKFQDEGGVRGKYYKEVKVYEKFYPLDAQPVSKTAAGERGYTGYIEYSHRLFQSERKSNRAEAAAAQANIRTDRTGRETYRYTFGPGGVWDGAKGERTRK